MYRILNLELRENNEILDRLAALERKNEIAMNKIKKQKDEIESLKLERVWQTFFSHLVNVR